METERFGFLLEILDDVGISGQASLLAAIQDDIAGVLLPWGPLIAFIAFFCFLHFVSKRVGLSEVRRAKIDFWWVAASATSLMLLVLALGFQSSAQKVTALTLNVQQTQSSAMDTISTLVTRLCHLPESARMGSDRACDVSTQALQEISKFGNDFHGFRSIPSYDQRVELLDLLKENLDALECIFETSYSEADLCASVTSLYQRSINQVWKYNSAIEAYSRTQEDYLLNSLTGIIRIMLLHLIAIAAAARLFRAVYDCRVARNARKTNLP